MNKSYSYLRCFIALHLFFSLLPFTGFGQNEKDNKLGSITSSINNKHKLQQLEKLYLQLDRSWYKPGDTIWYKAYLLDESLSSSLQSGLLYVELINDSSRVVKRQMLKVINGVAAGDIEIKRKMYPGNYTLRAYTNWMRNFGQESFFTRHIKIAPSGDQYWLINQQLHIDKDNKVNLALHFSDLTPKNIGFRDMQVNVSDEKNINLFKSTVMTDPYGNLPLKFGLPRNGDFKQLSLQVEDISKLGDGRKIIIPLQLNKPQNTDLQFMPEGGTLLADLPDRVGFKAINEDGKGVTEIKGQVYNSAMKAVASFQSTHKGMGSFVFTPLAGESYTAKVSFADGTTKSYTLPAVKSSGIDIQVNNSPGDDSLKLHIAATADININKYYTLIGQARNQVCYSEKFSFTGREIIKKMPKNTFPAGIVKFILLDAASQPVSRRMVFIDHGDQLNMFVNSNKKSYFPKDSVSLRLYVTDATGKPVQGSFSLAVTDDSRIESQPVDAESITSYMLLNADLKGTVEEPGYYFDDKHTDRAEALDNLLLTQGWVNYDWKQCFGPPEKLQYEAETQFKIKGRVSNVFNGSIANTELTLHSNFPPFTRITYTDKDGSFNFTDFPELERMDFQIQATRYFNIGIDVDGFIPPGLAATQKYATPWFVNSDSTFVNYVTDKNKINNGDNIRTKPDAAFEHGKRVLKEVVIKNNRLRPPPVVQLALDEEEMRDARTGAKPLTIMKLLNVKEEINHMFKFLLVDEKPYIPWNQIADMDKQWDINRWLEAYTTEDIQSIHVEKTFFNSKLGETPALLIYIVSNAQNGPDMPQEGAYVYHPMPFSHPDKFYSPRYTVKDATDVKDKRSTIYWAPDITTDANGKATVSFYTADLPGTYSLILEGSDMKGNVGYQKQQLRVVAK